MRIHPNKLKMLVFLKWLVQSHNSLLTDEDLEPPMNEEGADENYDALYALAVKYCEEYSNMTESSNFNAITQLLNGQIIRVRRTLSKEMGSEGCTLMILIVGALRHCNFDKLRDFDDLKQIDLDAIIARARVEGYLNKWKIQKLCRDFKYNYWEA